MSYFRKLSEDTYAVDGNAPLHELFDLLEMKEPEEFEATTVGGWVTEVMELIPSAGDTFDYKNLHIEVTKTDARRVIEIKLTVNEIEDEEDERRDKKEDKEEE